MAGDLAALFGVMGELSRRVAGGQHQGTVHEVKGDKIRVVWGRDPDGRPVLSPWLDTSDHRGGARERRFYHQGQNVTIATVNGDMNEAATVSADAPNQEHKAPDHADDAGAEAETYQLGELRITKKDDYYEVYFGQDGETKLRLEKDGRVLIKAKDKVEIDCPLVELTGDLHVKGEVKAKTDGASVSLSTHQHGGVERGGLLTDSPQGGT